MGGSTPSHFDRLRWWGAREGSRGEMPRMRTKPGSPVELAWRRGRATWREFAGWLFLDTTADTSERVSRRESVWLFSRTTADTKRPFPSTSERRWRSRAPSKNNEGGVL